MEGGRVPPQAIELEESVIGSMFIEPSAADEVFSKLTPDAFYKPDHKMIVETIQVLYSEGSPYNIMAVAQHLRDQNKLDMVGGDLKMSEMMNTADLGNIEYNCQIIKEKAIRRSLIIKSSEITQQAYDSTVDTMDVIDYAQSSIFDATDTSSGTMRHIGETMGRVMMDIEHTQSHGEAIGLRCGLDIDKTLRGFQNSKLYVIGARPSQGKTALVMTIKRRLAKQGNSSGIISLETSDKSLGIRLIAQITDLPADKIVSGKMSEEEHKRCLDAAGVLAGYGIYIDDEAALTAQQVRSKCRLMKRKGVQIIFVDFLQLINEKGRSRNEEIGKITKVLKQTAKELDIPIVILSQLSRKVEDRSDKRPVMSDLRDSGEIEQDADAILFLYRPEYYGITTTEEGESTDGLAEVIIAKNKDGKTGMHRQLFVKEFMRFENITVRPDSPPTTYYNEPNNITYNEESPF